MPDCEPKDTRAVAGLVCKLRCKILHHCVLEVFAKVDDSAYHPLQENKKA